MKEQDPYSFSKTVNRFIDSLKKHNDAILIETIGNETIILYEDWEHEPIKNYNSRCGEYRRTAEQRRRMSEVRMGKPKSKETREKIGKKLKNRVFSDIHKARISASKIKYYEDLKSEKTE